MKTSRLAVPANPCAGSRHRALASTVRIGNPIRRFVVATFFTAALCAPVSALNLAWNPNPESDIASYQVSYGTSPGVHNASVNAGLNTSASVSGLTAGTTYYFVVTATNVAGLRSAPSAEISYEVPGGPTEPSIPLISSAGWTLHSVTSEETEDEDGRAINAFDGNPNTYWISRWLTNAAPPPHELQIDLGAVQSIQGFRYLPRQDGYNIGNIGQFEFYVSMDGVSWGTAVAAGTFANNSAEKEVLFTSKTGRYVRLRALSDLNGGAFNGTPLSCVAELSLLQGLDTPLPENQAPLAVDAAVTTPEDTTVAISLSASDADGNSLTYSVVSGPSKGSLSGTAPNLTYRPDADANGSDSFTFRVNDGTVNSNTATVSISITPVNDAPVAAGKSVTTSENTAVSILLSASDKDSNSLSYTIISGPSKGALSGTAPNLTYTPSAGISGSDSFTFRASDGAANSNTATVSITVSPVNDAPVAAAKSVVTAEDVSVAIVLSASDADGDSLTYSVVSGPSKGSLSGTAPNLTYKPTADANGSDSFTFRVNDGTVNSNTATVSITITPVNDAPVAVGKSVVTSENTPVSILLSASDKDSNSLSYTIISGPSKGVLSGTAPNLTYTPSAGISGSDSFTFRASDGAANSNTATVSITVSPVNDAPVAAAKSIVTAEDVSVAIILSASDADGDSLTYSVVSGPSKGALSGTAPNLTYNPLADANGSDSFTFRVNDGTVNSNTATVSITITPVNDAPVAAAKSVVTSENTPVSILLSASDKDSNSLSYTIVSGPSKGALSGTAPNLTYTPSAGFSGSDSFTFRASDGAANSNTATISITVDELAPPPNVGPSFVTNPMVTTVAEDASIGGRLEASDPDETGALVYAKISGPSWLTVSPSGVLTGVPSNGDVGANVFMVRVTDSSAASSTASLLVTVTNTNDAPVFLLNPITAPASSAEVAYEGGSIADTATDADAGDVISFSKVDGPSWLQVSADGGLSGTPAADSAGMNSFTVRATDKAGAFVDALLQIIVASEELPLPWQLENLGGSGSANRASCASGSFVMEGSGKLGGTSDGGCYVWQTLSGDGMITARLAGFENADSESRLGVMIRDSLASNSPHVFMGMDGGGGLCYLRRSRAGNFTSVSTKGTGSIPDTWVRIVRKGRTVSAYQSANGFRWSRVYSATTTFGTHCYIGLSVGSGVGESSSATFCDVEVQP